jgi:hypothetical protein
MDVSVTLKMESVETELLGQAHIPSIDIYGTAENTCRLLSLSLFLSLSLGKEIQIQRRD